MKLKLEEQVCSLELAIRLKELGVPQDSVWYWVDNRLGLMTRDGCLMIDNMQILRTIDHYNSFCAAFTVAELGKMLPSGYKQEKLWMSNDWIGRQTSWVHADNSSEADLRATILVYLLEQGKIDARKLAETETESEV